MSMANTLVRNNMRTIIDPDSIRRAMVRVRRHALAMVPILVSAAAPAAAQSALPLDRISLPPGFKI